MKKEATALTASLQVGKAGVTEALVGELRTQLDREPLVKVKLLRSARGEEDRDVLAASLAEGAEATLVEVRGNTAVFYKPPKNRRPRRA